MMNDADLPVRIKLYNKSKIDSFTWIELSLEWTNLTSCDSRCSIIHVDEIPPPTDSLSNPNAFTKFIDSYTLESVPMNRAPLIINPSVSTHNVYKLS